MWHDIGVALALVLVFEGIMPFINPGGWKEMIAIVSQLEDNTLRMAGFGSMILGIIVLTAIN
ncbi:MAG: DUF2065 domain-containing protein [Pseudomonadales bacterium]|nr:DUF2065 domain-containing protein [Pseudomonadales bacterium]